MRAILLLVLFLAAAGSACSSGGAACTHTSDCSGGAECVYRTGTCTASGECLPPPNGAATCGALEQLCGCGSKVATGCGYPQGYASGPTTGQTSCH